MVLFHHCDAALSVALHRDTSYREPAIRVPVERVRRGEGGGEREMARAEQERGGGMGGGAYSGFRFMVSSISSTNSHTQPKITERAEVGHTLPKHPPPLTPSHPHQ